MPFCILNLIIFSKFVHKVSKIPQIMRIFVIVLREF